jgi:hypothetical protein
VGLPDHRLYLPDSVIPQTAQYQPRLVCNANEVGRLLTVKLRQD